MWTVHKQLFGSTCDSNCECVFKLPELVDNVIVEALDKQKKGKLSSKRALVSTLRADKLPIGLTGNFANRFLPRLRRQFPNESPQKILERFKWMWTIHKKAFSRKCLPKCQCIQGWEDKFFCGDRERMLARNRSLANTTASSEVNGVGKVPKKRKVTHTPAEPPIPKKVNMGAANNSSLLANVPDVQIQNQRSSKTSSTKHDALTNSKRHATPQVSNQAKAPAAKRQRGFQFRVTFDATQPLGCYFENKIQGISQKTACVVSSVRPGLADMDKNLDNNLDKIMRGTRVIAVEHNGIEKDVNSFEELREFYGRSKKLVLICTNAEIERML
jgi:hypothetical protein